MGPQQKKKPRGGVFFFAAAPRGHSLTHCGPGWCLPLAGVVFFFLLRPRPDRGGVFFCCGPAQTLTHSLWAGAISARFGWCFFFWCGPARSFLVSLKRPGGAAAKKNPRGGVFFFAAAPRGRSLTHCGPGWCLPLAGVVFFFLLRPRPDRGGVFFLLRPRPDRGGVFFFAAAPRGRSLTHCGPGWCLPLAGVVFFFLLRPRPDRGGVFFFAVAPPGRSLTHCGLGRFRQGSGGVFFFCCGPARSFLDSLKRPGGAAAKKKPRGGVFFFAAAPRGRSLTHCGPGWCLPLAGVVFFFFAAAPPGPGWCFFFCCGPARTGVVFFFLLWPRPDAHSLTVGWGDFGKVRVVFFFLLWPRPVFFG